MGNGFGDLDKATRVRDVIASISKQAIRNDRPSDVYATVQAIDRVGGTCDITFPGESTTITLPMGAIQPQTTGTYVRVVGVAQDRRVDSPAAGSATYLNANTVAATAATITTVTASAVISATSTNLSIDAGAGGTLKFDSSFGGVVEFGATGSTTNVKVVTSDGGNVLPQTGVNSTFPFFIGSASTAASNYRMAFTARGQQALNAGAVDVLEMNPQGGAVRANGYPLAPLFNVQNAAVGSVPAVTATSPGFKIQAGRQQVNFTAGSGTLTFGTAFPNGLLCVVATSELERFIIAHRPTLGSSVIQASLSGFQAYDGYLDGPPPPVGGPGGGQVWVNYVAVGW